METVRVAHVVAGLDQSFGGLSYSVPRLCAALASAGAKTTLLSVAAATAPPGDTLHDGYHDRRFVWDYAQVPILRDLRKTAGLAKDLRRIAPSMDIVHNHGLWLLPNIYAGRESRRARKPLVVSPRGMFNPAALRFSNLKKQAFWRLLQGVVIRRAACIHATSESERQDIRAFGLTNPVSIIPNGIDLPELCGEAGRVALGERLVLSLGRMHPIKGLDRLLRAWAQVEKQNPDWRLQILGPVEHGYDEELRRLNDSLGGRRVSIDGPLYGADKLRAYRSADIFVLPSLTENFGLTVAEALAAETPVIATKGTPWAGLEASRCGWWIDHGVEALTAALTGAMAMPRPALKAMGQNGRAWMQRDFSWDRVAHDMLELYAWIAGRSPAPSTVCFD